MAARFKSVPADDSRREELVTAAIVVGSFDLAVRLIGARAARRISVTLAVGKNAAHPTGAVAWEISGPTACRFKFDAHLFRVDHTELFIYRWFRLLPLCFHYMQSAAPETGKVCVSLDDHGSTPGMAFCDHRPEYFLIPDPVFLLERGYRDVRAEFSANAVPWRRRAPIAFWRGSSSGKIPDRNLGWRSLPRVKLCQIAAQFPEIIDAKIAHIGQMPDAASAEELRQSGLVGPPTPLAAILDSKYQIDIDGNSNAWSGLFQKLLSGGAVLKVTSAAGHRQWYYDRLKAWIHYVPVESDLSDLVEKVNWLRLHDSAARKIGTRGRMLAESLDYDAELAASVEVITAAFRHFAGREVCRFQFGSQQPDNGRLGRGWTVVETDSAWAIGAQSELSVAAPLGGGAHVVDLDVSPWPAIAAGAAQRVVVAVNGEIVQQIGISGRQTLRCTVPERALLARDLLRVTLLHPEARRLAAADFPADERVVGGKLHGLTLIALANAAPLPAPNRTGAPVPAGVAAAPAIRAPSSRQRTVMLAIHGDDVWRAFLPAQPRQPSIQGWNGRHPSFRPMLENVSNRTFVDVGAWKGQATVFVAGLMRSAKMDGCVIAVDTFLGAANHWISGRDWFGRVRGRADLYETFLENVYYAKATDYVVPFAQTSLAAAAVLRQRRIKAGIVHIDGSQDYAGVLADAEAYWPLIEPGGYLVGDDYHETWPNVMRAAQDFCAKQGLSLVQHTPKWIVRKPP
jgi:hypothetical protein